MISATIQTIRNKGLLGGRFNVVLGLLTLLLLALASPTRVSASASNIYLAPAAAGTGNGSDCADALAASWFNSSSNWGSGANQIGPGTVVHLCSGTYSYPGTSCGLTFQGSGSGSGSITLIADQGAAVITAPAWQGSSSGIIAGICTNSQNYLVINGANNLTIQATENGTGLAYQADSTNGINALWSNNLTIENLTIANIYVHACAEPIATCTDENGQSTGCISVNGSNITVAYVTGHDAKWCINASTPTGVANVNVSLHHNTMYRIDHGIAVGMGGTNSTLSGLLIHDNDISQFQPWDDAANNNHHDGIHIWSYNSGDNVTGARIYNNYIHGDWGAGVNAAMYAEARTGMPGAVYFNNVVVDQSSVSHQGCGSICTLVNGVSVVNNTIVGGGTALNFYGTSIVSENNSVTGAFEAMSLESGASISSVDYNNYYNIGGNGWNLGSFSGWQSNCHCEAHSTQTNPNISSSFLPTSASTALISKGINLSGMSVAALNQDRLGSARPGMPAGWTIGAYNYSSATAVNPPSNLVAVVE